jgi:replicative DNA helicase
MSEQEVYRRFCTIHTDIPATRLREGSLLEDDFPKMTLAFAKFRKKPLHIVDTGGMTTELIRGAVKAFVQNQGVQLVVVDYLQHIKSTNKDQNRTYQIGEDSEALKEMAKEFNVAVVSAAQLKRDFGADSKTRLPNVTDLADSKEIEQDADLICLLHRGGPDGTNDRDATLVIGKQRDGPTGIVKLGFQPEYAKFVSVSPIDADDYKNPHAD